MFICLGPAQVRNRLERQMVREGMCAPLEAPTQREMSTPVETQLTPRSEKFWLSDAPADRITNREAHVVPGDALSANCDIPYPVSVLLL